MIESARVFSPFAIAEDQSGVWRLTLHVDGVHCAGCINRIESTLRQDHAVRQARLNFSTRRLALSWQGKADHADDLARRIQDLGYTVLPFQDQAEGKTARETRELLFALAVAGFAAGNIMLLSLALWMTDHQTMGPAMRDFLHGVSALIAVPAVIYAGRPFFISAATALRHGRTNMDVPISVGLILTCGISFFELARGGEHAFFDSAVMLMFFLLIGRYLDAKARAHARGAASDLLALMQGTVTVRDADGTTRLIPARQVVPGMTILVAMGERILADGVIAEGETQIDLSMATGEWAPVAARAGDTVISGTLNMGAPIVMTATRPADGSFLADIVRLMEAAEQGQARYVRLADRAARLYTPVVHVLALATFIAWVAIGGMAWPPALLIAATVLIITCPCALGLAVPVVQVLATHHLMKRGVLVKAGDAFERLAAIDTIIFDKTGTLTQGHPEWVGRDAVDLVHQKYAASLAAASRHPLAQAISRTYTDPLFDLAPEEVPGQGLRAQHQGQEIRLGNRLWCGAPESTGQDDEYLETWCRVGNAAPVRFTFADPVRRGAQDVITDFRKRNMRTILLSGDAPGRVQKFAARLGIDEYYGGQTPQQKFDFIEGLRAKGAHVLMVGDGLNDAPVLAAAHVSMSPCTAAHVTQNAADMVLTGSDLAGVRLAWRVARRATALVKQNFALAVLYNIIAVPLAMAGYVTPLVAAIAMSLSSLVVIGNSYRLRTVS